MRVVVVESFRESSMTKVTPWFALFARRSSEHGGVEAVVVASFGLLRSRLEAERALARYGHELGGRCEGAPCGEGAKAESMAANKVSSAVFRRNGVDGSITADANLVQASTLDLIAGSNPANFTFGNGSFCGPSWV